MAGTAQPLARDLTLRPYHSQPFARADEVYRSQAKSGTSHAHAYATAYIIRHGRWLTLALTILALPSRPLASRRNGGVRRWAAAAAQVQSTPVAPAQDGPPGPWPRQRKDPR